MCSVRQPLKEHRKMQTVVTKETQAMASYTHTHKHTLQYVRMTERGWG